jgi:Pectinacetylesterase
MSTGALIEDVASVVDGRCGGHLAALSGAAKSPTLRAMILRGWQIGALFACSMVVGCGGGAQVGASSLGAGAGGGGILTGAGGASVMTGAGGAGSVASTTASVSAGAGGAGGAGPTCPLTPPITGSPISAPDQQWTWVPIPGAVCRDGSATGIGVRLNSASKKVYVYLEGGGACFNDATCAISLGSFGEAAFEAWAGTVGLTGVFDTTQNVNPVQDWNAVYVPYCSGDVHAGAVTGADVPGAGSPQNQDFVGYQNMGLYLQRIVPTFADATTVLLTGISAGGFGAALNYDRVASAFCPQPVMLLDDSGPPMSDTYLAPCLQKQWRGLWNLAATLPSSCADCTEPSGGGIVNYVTYLANRWPNSNLGLISSTHDAVISTFYGFGADDCTASVPLAPETYEAGLDDLRANYLSTSGHWGSYFIDSITHTWLLGPGFYTTSVNGVPLTQWVEDLLAGAPGNIGP